MYVLYLLFPVSDEITRRKKMCPRTARIGISYIKEKVGRLRPRVFFRISKHM